MSEKRWFRAVSDGDYDYEGVRPTAWVKGETYEASDDGEVLMMAVEPGGQVYVTGIVREWFLAHFTFRQVYNAQEARDG